MVNVTPPVTSGGVSVKPPVLPYPTDAELSGTYVPGGLTPPDPAEQATWSDSSTVPPTLKGWNGSAWVAIGGGGSGGNLDGGSASSTYSPGQSIDGGMAA